MLGLGERARVACDIEDQLTADIAAKRRSEGRLRTRLRPCAGDVRPRASRVLSDPCPTAHWSPSRSSTASSALGSAGVCTLVSDLPTSSPPPSSTSVGLVLGSPMTRRVTRLATLATTEVSA